MVHEKLENAINAKVYSPKLPTDCPSLPLETAIDAEQFEKFLANEDNFALVCNVLGNAGGSTLPDCVRRILTQIVSNPLSRIYSWKGTRGLKLAFSELVQVIKLISAITRNHLAFENATNKDVEDVVKKWLMHSMDRDGGRAKRK